MRILNISRQSGGAGIKLKTKISSTLKFILASCGGVFLFLMVLNFIDTNLNGLILDWFAKEYTYTTSHVNADGLEQIVTSIDWDGLKLLIIQLFCLLIVLWIASLMLIKRIYFSKTLRSTISRISQLIHTYLKQEVSQEELFPREYAEIAAELAQAKSSMQRQEQLLKEEAGRKNDLITYLAHDLKTPLTSVIGYLSLLDEAADMPAPQREKYIHITLDKAYRLEKLINEFFDITRYNLQQIVLEEETIDLYYMLVQLTDEFYPLLSAHGNTIKLTAPEQLIIHGDPSRLARVFNNILKNAVAYSYPDTAIEVTASVSDTEVWICFQNHGATIPEHKLDSLFEKFFRLDENRSTNTGGAGLGLAIAREIITLHGGTITAESQNELTSFIISLPLVH